MNNTGHTNLNKDADLDLLRKCSLFSELAPDAFESVVKHSSVVELNVGQFLFHQQRPAYSFHLLILGKLKLFRLSLDGKEKIIEIISPGSAFGEAIMFSDDPVYPVSAAAIEGSQVFCIDASNYRRILESSTDACFRIMANMSRRLHAQIAEIDRLTLHSAASRFANFLMDNLISTDSSETVVKLEITKRDIASKISVTPETLSRIISRFQHDNLISVDENFITLMDVRLIRKHAEDFR